MRLKSSIKYPLFILLILSVCVTLFFAEKSDIWELDVTKQRTIDVSILDTKWNIISDDTFADDSAVILSRPFFAEEVRASLPSRYYNSSENRVSGDPTLCFSTVNQSVRVFKEKNNVKELLYSFGNNGKFYVGSECGKAVHFVSLPHAGEEDFNVIVELQPSFSSENLRFQRALYSNRKVYIPKFWFANFVTCMNTFIRKSMIQLIPVIIMLVMGAAILCYYFNLGITRKHFVKEYKYWGTLAIVSGFGFFMESTYALYIFDNSFFIYYASTVALAFCPRLFSSYITECKPTVGESKVNTFFIWFSPINIFLVTAAAFIKVFPYIIIRKYAEIFLLLYVVFMIFEIAYNSVSFKTRLSDLEKIILFSGSTIIIDFFLNIVKRDKTDIYLFSRPGMMIFFFLSIIVILNEVHDREQLQNRSLLMEQYAYRDLSSGCQNNVMLEKNYRKFSAANKKFSIMIITLSNTSELIKFAGIESRETAIRIIYQQLLQIFQENSIYKTGASRFCILLSEEQSLKIEEYTAEIKKKLNNYDFKNMSAAIKIDIQTENFEDVTNIDFEDLYIHVLNSPHVK